MGKRGVITTPQQGEGDDSQLRMQTMLSVAFGAVRKQCIPHWWSSSCSVFFSMKRLGVCRFLLDGTRVNRWLTLLYSSVEGGTLKVLFPSGERNTMTPATIADFKVLSILSLHLVYSLINYFHLDCSPG